MLNYFNTKFSSSFLRKCAHEMFLKFLLYFARELREMLWILYRTSFDGAAETNKAFCRLTEHQILQDCFFYHNLYVLNLKVKNPKV